MAKYWRIVHRGLFQGTGEVFAHSHHAESDDSEDMTSAIAALNAARTALFTSTFLGSYHTTVLWQGVDIYQVNLAGGPAIDHGNITNPFQGTVTGSTILPLEVACVLTLRTAVLLRRGRGRMYLPPQAVSTVDATGQWTGTARGIVGTGFQLYFTSMAGNGFIPSVKGLSTPGPGYVMREITSIDVGSIPDSQRRRRNKQVELRNSFPI